MDFSLESDESDSFLIDFLCLEMAFLKPRGEILGIYSFIFRHDALRKLDLKAAQGS